MQNRYKDTIADANQLILDLTPTNYVLRQVLAIYMKQNNIKGKGIEIGCGEGDLTKYLLSHNSMHLTALDVSARMISKAKKNLSEFEKSISYITKDALVYLTAQKKESLDDC